MSVHMKKIYIYMFTLLCAGVVCSLTGCGRNDRLVLVTTEKSTTESNVTATENKPVEINTEQTAEQTTEAASKEELATTLEDIVAANSGDIFLTGGTGCSAKTIYYSSGTEIYSENRYVGFDERGVYLQAYEDSDGNSEVLDNYNQCWYVFEDGTIYTRLYPEDGVAARIIDYNHRYTVVEPYDGETIMDIYRQDGALVAETKYTDDYGDEITRFYHMTEGLVVDDIYCYDSYGDKLSYEYVSKNAVYNTPDELKVLLDGDVETRTVEVVYSDGDGMGNIYNIPRAYELTLDLYQYKAYADEECTTEWKDETDTSGMYTDCTIYLKK